MQESEIRERPAIKGSLVGALLALAVNLGIQLFDVGEEPAGTGFPGPVNAVIYTIVPFVWIALFAAIGTAWFLLRAGGRAMAVPSMAAALLLANCALYPVYTLGFSSRELGLAGNGLTAVLAAFAIGTALERSPRAALLMAPVVIWVALASVGLVAVMTGRTF
jgi:tryptophan-rich sensory protein